MSTHSLEALLEKLENISVTLGWGAVAAFSRERVNLMLEQQFTAAFTASRFIAPCSGEVDKFRLTDIVFGAPVLSFETASLGGAAATLTIPLLAGSYRQSEGAVGRSPSVISGTSIRSHSGTALTMDIDLEQVTSDSDNTGRIAIDLGKASNPTCSLVSDPATQKRIGEFFLAYLRKQPKHKTTYVLGLVDGGNYAPLNPVKFAIRTQPAPGATQAGARNAGDGAVLVFMKLQGYDDEGQFPGADFPYLIPDDVFNGKPVYSASLFVTRWLSHFVNDANLAVLKTSVLPAGYSFVEASGGRYTPNDIAMFGHLAATRSNVLIEPQVSDIDMLKSLSFTARRGDDSAVTGVSWSASCLNSPLSPGEISSSGNYTALNYAFGTPSVRMTTVTARYTENGQPAEASAFLLVRYQGLGLEPLVSTCAQGAAAVTLLATGDGADAALGWTLLEPNLGAVAASGGVGQAKYTPPSAGGVPLVAQRIEARNQAAGVSAEAAVVLLATPTTLPIEPPFVGSVFGMGEVSFEVPEQAARRMLDEAGATSADDVFWRWSVVGEGTVVGNGRTARFTPPATRTANTLSILVCEMLGPDVDYVCGYAAVQMATMGVQDYPHWQSLAKFEVKAPDGVQAQANGMQQIRVQVRIETAAVDLDGNEVRIPISDVELASLTLVHRTSGSEVPFVDPLQDGIEHGDSLQWAASERRNRFNLYPAMAAGEQESVTPADDGGVRYRDLYLLLKTDESNEFYAQFKADDGRIMRSVDIGQPEEKSITVKGVQPPALGPADYEFQRERVWNGQGKIVDTPSGPDEFSYMLQSIDFWRLAFRKQGYETAGFATLKIDGNTSSIQWESELVDETFFSCTGYAFSPKHRLQPTPPTQLSFDPYLDAMMTAVSHAQPNSSFHSQPPSPGDLVVSLHRDFDVAYWYDGQAEGNKAKLFRQVLDGPVTYTLRDENGNRHKMQIGFKDRSLENSRNTLNLIIQ